MIRGIFSSAAGMITQYKKINVLGNNTSNVNTPGFKQSDVSFTSFGDEIARRMNDNSVIGDMQQYVVLGSEKPDLSQGDFKQTNLNTDLAVEGNGFFEVQDGTGVKYTRSGDFSVDTQGFLALPTGERLVGANGTPLQVGTDNFSVSADGTVSTAAGTVGKINLYTAQNNAQITMREDGFFNINGAQQANGLLKQGWVENSNTDVVGNVTEMMEATRSFQGCQQAFEVTDQTLDKLVTQVGSAK